MKRTENAMIRAAALIGLIASGVGCGKTTTKIEDKPETLARIDTCNKTLSEAERRIAALETELEVAKLAAGGEVTVKIEGSNFVVTPPAVGAGPGPQLDDATLAANSKLFVDFVGKSRAPIQRCYEQALKRNASLGNGSVKLSISATFAAVGEFKKLTLKPDIDDGFAGCMNGVAGKWKLPTAKAGSTYQANIELRPN